MAEKKRMERFWTTTLVPLSITAASVGVASQAALSLEASFETAFGATLRGGVTVGRSYLQGFWGESNEATSPINFAVHVGIGLFTKGTLVTQFPDLSLHAGDWFLHDARGVQETVAAIAGTGILRPDGAGANIGGSVAIASSGQRTIKKREEVPFIVVQKDSVTEQDIFLHAELTVLWLLL